MNYSNKFRVLIQEYQSSLDAIEAQIEFSISGIPQTEIDENKLYYYEYMDNSDPDLFFWSSEETQMKPALTPPSVWIVNNSVECEKLLECLMLDSSVHAWDTETSGLDTFTCKIVGVGVTWSSNINGSAYIPIAHSDGNNLDWSEFVYYFKYLLENEGYKKVFQNAKYDVKVFKQHRINIQGIYWDTMLASQVIDAKSHTSHKIEDIVSRYYTITYTIPVFDELIKEVEDKKKRKNKFIGDLSIERTGYYCQLDTYHTYMCFLHQRKVIGSLQDVLDLEMQVLPILIEMEVFGLKLDQEWYESQCIELAKKKDRIVQKVQAYKKGLNIGSTQQLNKFFFGELGLNPTGLKQIKTGYSLDENNMPLLKGKHPVCDLVLDYRGITKLKSTYIEGVYNKKSPVTGRLHTSYNQIGAVTGRMSSENPNGQNFPKEARAGIIADDGYVFLSIDYSGCEYRILTHFSKSKFLLEEYLSGGDSHTAVCRMLYPDKNPKDKDPITGRDFRFIGKTVNFSIVYGQEIDNMSIQLRRSIQDCIRIQEMYWSRIPEVRQLMIKTWKKLISTGYTETILGRRRYYDITDEFYMKQRGLPWEEIELRKKNTPHMAEVLRQGFNARIQGSNADITKLAMVKTDPIIKENQSDTKLLLQIHDELVFMVPFEELSYIKPLLMDCMRSIGEDLNMILPLEVDSKVCLNWGMGK